MSAFSGPQTDAGAMRRRREQKRREAEERNAATPRERTRQWRRDKATVRAALDKAHPTQGTGGNA